MYYYYRDNIRFGYRAHRGNLDAITCAKTAFCGHCETLNIWTHGIPLLSALRTSDSNICKCALIMYVNVDPSIGNKGTRGNEGIQNIFPYF